MDNTLKSGMFDGYAKDVLECSQEEYEKLIKEHERLKGLLKKCIPTLKTSIFVEEAKLGIEIEKVLEK